MRASSSLSLSCLEREGVFGRDSPSDRWGTAFAAKYGAADGSGKVRLATLLLVLVGGLSIWVYILLWIVVPKGPKRLEGNSR